MRTLFIIIGWIAGAVSIDLLSGFLSTLLPTQLCDIVGSWGMIASWTILPAAFVMVPAKRGAGRNWPLRLFLATVVSWYATLVFRMSFDLPATRALAHERGDYTYDGVGMNAALLVTGWIPPLIVALVTFALFNTFRFGVRHLPSNDVGCDTNPEVTEPESL